MTQIKCERFCIMTNKWLEDEVPYNCLEDTYSDWFNYHYYTATDKYGHVTFYRLGCDIKDPNNQQEIYNRIKFNRISEKYIKNKKEEITPQK